MSQEVESPSVELGPRSPLWKQFLYGVGNFGRYMPIAIQSFYINPYLLEVGLLSSFTVGTILLLAQIWDATTDPIVGRISDLTKTRFGRRKPYIFLACIPSAILWTLLWTNPTMLNDKENLKAVYFALLIFSFSTLNTCVSVPYFSLLPFVVKTSQDRTTVAFFQQISGLVAGMLFTFITGQFLDYFGLEKGYSYGAMINSVVIVIFAFVSVFFIKESADNTGDIGGKNNFFLELIKGIFSALALKEFRIVVSMFVLSVLAIFLTINNIYLFVQLVVRVPEQASLVILSFQISVTVSLFFWAFLTRRIGKKRVYYLGALLWFASLILLFFIQEEQTTVLYVLISLRGFGSGVGYLIPYIMLPDAIEIDAKKRGVRREGTLYSIFILFQKVALAIGISSSNYVLGFAGYEEVLGDNQPAEVYFALRVLTNIVPIVLLIFAILFVYFYPTPKVGTSRPRKAGAKGSSGSSGKSQPSSSSSRSRKSSHDDEVITIIDNRV